MAANHLVLALALYVVLALLTSRIGVRVASHRSISLYSLPLAGDIYIYIHIHFTIFTSLYFLSGESSITQMVLTSTRAPHQKPGHPAVQGPDLAVGR